MNNETWRIYKPREVYRTEGIDQLEWIEKMEVLSLARGDAKGVRREWIETFLDEAPPACDLEISSFTPQGAFTDRIRKSNAVKIERRLAA